jgi:hypothetical protein
MPAPVSPEQETETFAAYQAIAATLQHYVNAARTADAGRMRLAFAATARIAGTYSGKAVEWTVSEFCDLIQKGGPAPDLEAQIVAIEYAGNAAVARLGARNWRGTRYSDFFVLVERDGLWRISSKVFFPHSRA